MSESDIRDKWLHRLDDENKAHIVFRKRAREAEDAYLEYKEDDAGPIFPLFPTTINLVHGRIYGRQPKPDVRKRHPSAPMQAPQPAQQPAVPPPGGPPPPAQGLVQAALPSAAPNDPTADDNTIAMTLERALTYTIDTTQFDRNAHMTVHDFLVAGLGAAKVEMDTERGTAPVIDPMTMQPLLDEDGQPLKETVILSQSLHLRHFHWSQFRWEPAKDWRQVKWVSFDHEMTKDDIENKFNVTIDSAGEGGSKGGVDAPANATGAKQPQMAKYKATYTVHEIWDKRKKKRLFISDCYDKILREESDPLKLKDFFPCPPPMMEHVSGIELMPTPDYHFYRLLTEHASELMRRIRELTKQVRDIGFYDESFVELKEIYEYKDGSIIAVKNLLERLRSVDGKAESGSILFQVDMKAKAEVLLQLMQQLEATKAKIWEINGIADIQRGVSNPNDTATAQNIKNQWADIRTGQRVQTVALFFRDIFRIMAQIISRFFGASQIEAMSGVMLTPNQIATLRSDIASAYAIDVESDSTMVQDDAMRQEQTMQFLQAFTGYVQQMLPAVQNGMLPADIAKEVLLAVKDSFKGGRQLEQAINSLPNTLQQLQKMTGQIHQLGQQNQQLQQQLQDTQTKLQQVNMHKEAREDAKTATDNEKTKAEAIKDMIDVSKSSREDRMQAMATGIE